MRWWLGALAATALACSGDDDGLQRGRGAFEIPDEPLSGIVGGDDWSIAGGVGGYRFTIDDGSHEVRLHSEAVDCDEVTASPGLLIWATLGVHEPLSNDAFVSLFTGSDTVTTTAGRLELERVDGAYVGGLVFDYDAANAVAGTFEVVDCSPAYTSEAR